MRLSGGHVLDANQRVGSLGWNTPMRLDPIARRVNFGITGNLRYGASFQGLVPYRSTYEFGSLLGRLTCPSITAIAVGGTSRVVPDNAVVLP